MDNSLQALCEHIKKILLQLKPEKNALSFLIMTGKEGQGKSALLKQSRMEEVPVLGEEHARIYFNQNGIILELGEAWFNQSKTLLQHTLKQLNRCNPHLKITGLILCIAVNDLLITDAGQFSEQKKSHIQIIERLSLNLSYPTELALICTKMDTLAGFCEFYQTDHAMDLANPLGFSLDAVNKPPSKMAAFAEHFNQLMELVGQQVIQKMHPARSTMKRSLIREFPLQLASLRQPMQSLIQGIPCQLFNLHSLYFTSAEQGGVSIDRLSRKIQHEYALKVQDSFTLANNFRQYFIEGALKRIQEQCKQVVQAKKIAQKPLIAFTSSLLGVSILLLLFSHCKTTQLLDEASRELISYTTLSKQNEAEALYHLSKAANTMGHIPTLSLPTISQLKSQVKYQANQRLQLEFLPSLLKELEETISSPSQTPVARYRALKVYLMLGVRDHYFADDIEAWFKEQWSLLRGKAAKKPLLLLRQILDKPHRAMPLNQQVITDARNYLNALPASYFYYSLAKDYFPKKEEKIAIEGFSLAATELPLYFTKAGFKRVIKEMPSISKRLQAENWVLARQDLDSLQERLIEAYCFHYVTWWRTFMQKSRPLAYQEYQKGREVVQLLKQSNGMANLMHWVQKETQLDLSDQASLFNQKIANQFADLNLISVSSIKELQVKISEIERFLATLSVVQDEGKTAFGISKSRFMNANASDPLSALFNQARQFPEPLKTWTEHLANDTWFILIRDSRQYINKQWQELVYREFKEKVADRYPFYPSKTNDISLPDFNHFFSAHGALRAFTDEYLKPFLDTSSAQWKPKAVNEVVLPISSDTLDELIRANIITTMFYPEHTDTSSVQFSLQKISLDPVVSSLNLTVGETSISDNQSSDSSIQCTWPQNGATLALNSIEGKHYEIKEQGVWALFKLLEKVNVLVDEQDSATLQILFEVNGNSGRYLLKTNNKVNPFTPGILNGFTLNEAIV